MAKGFALLVGLDNRRGERAECPGAELDVDKIHNILKPLGYTIRVLKTAEATRDKVMSALRGAVSGLSSDDIFVFYYSGHGGQRPDLNDDEEDGKDETLLAYDREIVDDELNEIWLSAAEGSRMVMISDSCNSGTIYKFMSGPISQAPFVPILDKETAAEMKAQLIHLGGCRDSAASVGGVGGGLFTRALCDTWAKGTFQGSYPKLLDEARYIVERQRPDQVPQYNECGPVTDRFRNSRPFQI